jgi:hypothetical protein
MNFFGNPIKRLVKGMLVCGFSSAMAVTPLFAQVYTGTLAGLANGGTLTIDDKTFSDFSYQFFGLTAFDPTAITVTASESGGVDYLNWVGSFAVNNTAGTANLIGDVTLTYTVTANPGSINMIDQAYTPLPATTQSSGQIIIGETVANSLGITVANSTLTLNPPVLSDPPAQPGDNLNINPSENQLFVSKDILIIAYGGNLVGLSNVEQSFHQVPEPSVMLLGSLGGGLLLFLKSRRQARRN